MINDPIADFLTRLRNAVLARKGIVVANASKLTKRIAEVLRDAGYIDSFELESQGPANLIKISLKYDTQGKSVLEGLKRVSTPGLRAYCGVDNIPSVRDGMGLSILSTSKGILTGDEARKINVGGEILCLVW